MSEAAHGALLDALTQQHHIELLFMNNVDGLFELRHELDVPTFRLLVRLKFALANEARANEDRAEARADRAEARADLKDTRDFELKMAAVTQPNVSLSSTEQRRLNFSRRTHRNVGNSRQSARTMSGRTSVTTTPPRLRASCRRK
jgi:hypothetical protein